MSTTNINYKALHKRLYDPYFVQWVTKFDSVQGQMQVVGFCVRRHKTWETVFYNESETVCRKVCDMLNEGS